MLRALVMAATLGVSGLAWAQQESGEYYPALAAQQGMGGTVTLDCLVNEAGRVACQVVEEAPLYWEFGDAALEVSRRWRVDLRTTTGQPTAGGRLRRTLVFEPGPPARIRHVTPLRTSRRAP